MLTSPVAKLAGATLSDADLTDAMLLRADLSFATLTGAIGLETVISMPPGPVEASEAGHE